MTVCQTDLHVLYRFFSSTGQLLYVGITMNPPARFRAHRDDKAWWSEVVGITVESYASREELASAERRAIRVERPLYNKIHNDVQRTNLVKAKTETVITYFCDVCKAIIEPGTGYISVSDCEIRSRRSAYADYKRALPSPARARLVPAMDIFTLPSPARWYAHHRVCDPWPESNDYWIDIERVNTYEKLLWRTAHLLEKTWFQHTDWGQFLYAQLNKKQATRHRGPGATDKGSE